MSQAPPKLLIIGAHPDDAEFHAGGLATIYRRLGYPVKMLSVTDGRAGHQSLPSEMLIELRRGEAAAAAKVIGAESEVWPFPDGELVVSLDLRHAIISAIRTYQPDLVLTHRTCDYHPDHRAVGQAVQDASYMVTVPKIVPDVPALARDPVVAYLSDLFTRPAPMRPDVAIDISAEFDSVVAMLACHGSQFFQWLPYNQGILDQVPHDDAGRIAWLSELYRNVVAPRADRCRAELVSTYGLERGSRVELCEMYEISEYARRLDGESRKRLFPISTIA